MKISVERLRQLIKEEIENSVETEEVVELSEEEGEEKQEGPLRAFAALLPRIQNRKMYEALLKNILTYDSEKIDKAMALKNVVGNTAASSILELLGKQTPQATTTPEPTT
jgi:hypothetical protein